MQTAEYPVECFELARNLRLAMFNQKRSKRHGNTWNSHAGKVQDIPVALNRVVLEWQQPDQSEWWMRDPSPPGWRA